jgi:hypothetical protein
VLVRSPYPRSSLLVTRRRYSGGAEGERGDRGVGDCGVVLTVQDAIAVGYPVMHCRGRRASFWSSCSG